MKANALREVARLLAYTAGAVAILTLYIIIPLIIALTPLLDDNWSRLFAALGILTPIEIVMIAILAKTSLRPGGRGERRGSVRVPADFAVKISSGFAGADAKLASRGRAVNASREGLAVLVESGWPGSHLSHIPLQADLPGEPAVKAKARIVSSEEVRGDGRRRRLLRLHLVAMDREDKLRYHRHLARLNE